MRTAEDEENMKLSAPAWQAKSLRLFAFVIRGGMSAMALYGHLKERKIITAPRGERLRIAPHFYNTLDEIDELVETLLKAN